MSNDEPEQIQHDIERSRNNLGSSLEQIGDRVAPGKVVARTKRNVTEKVSEKVEDVKERVSPVRVAKRQGVKVRSGFREFMGAGNEATEAGRDVARQGIDLAGRTGRSAGQTARRAASALADAPNVVDERVQSKPLAAGLVGFAAGFFLASILPPTEQEERFTQRLRQGLQPLAQEAVGQGREVAQDLAQSGKSRLEEVKRAADDATERVKAEVEDHAHEMKRAAASSAQTVRRQARLSAEDVAHEAKPAVDTTVNTVADAARRPAGRR